MKSDRNKAAALFFGAILILILLNFLSSCRIKEVLSSSDRITASTLAGENSGQNVTGTTEDNSSVSGSERENRLVFFDYKKIKLETTTSIGVKIKNCNLVLDYFGNLNFLGEIENLSSSSKTSLVITLEFFDKKNELIFSDTLPLNINYLRVSSKIPFSYTVKDPEHFINISKIKAGINYKDYYKLFTGNTIAQMEKFFYENNILNIEGRLINIGESKVNSLFLLATFFDKKDGVVFIRQCYLPKNNLLPQEQENFSLEVELGKYTPGFTHYDFEVFFEDSVKMP
ncbi:MAG: hypothetical protein ACYCZ1_03230 [Candidatus Humimicrobiaceae bacterium]